MFLGKDRRFRIIVRHKSRLGIVKQLVVSLLAKRRFSDSETAYLWPRNGISKVVKWHISDNKKMALSETPNSDYWKCPAVKDLRQGRCWSNRYTTGT